jgi:hypothetical protein
MLNIDNVDSWPFKLKQILTKLKIRQTNQIVIMVKSENLRNTAVCAAVQNRGWSAYKIQTWKISRSPCQLPVNPFGEIVSIPTPGQPELEDTEGHEGDDDDGREG